ncbi:hypothetical protein WP50_08045 [Lactiplantibacillus plantarum]|nr:hypothetical protein WP50_08045 [Lactiplantibacillus plantarum]
MNQEKSKLKNTTNQLFKSQPMQLFGCSGPVYVGRICGGSAVESMVTKRPGTPDEIANLAELLMDRRGAFITGSDFLVDGGITAQYWYGNVSEVRNNGVQK